jgi:hypothetical protein
MQPNERFIASGTGDDGDTIRWFEAQANSNGSFVTSLSQLPWFQDLPDYDTNYLYDSVAQIDIIGQMGSFVTLESVEVEDPENGDEWYSIPVRYVAPLMREIVWGGNYDEASARNLLLSWTCPGASPIRLRRDAGAIVLEEAGAQRIYLEPSLNAEVDSTRDPGDTVYVFSGIECADNGVWWYTGDGWFMESQGNRYFWQPEIRTRDD